MYFTDFLSDQNIAGIDDTIKPNSIATAPPVVPYKGTVPYKMMPEKQIFVTNQLITVS